MKEPERRVIEVSAGGATATAAKGGIVVAALFLVFGIIFFAVVADETPDSETGELLVMYAFAAVWVVACGAIIVMNLRLLRKRAESPSSSLFHIEETTAPARDDPASDDPAPAGKAGPAQGDFADRLRALEGLREDGLLSEEEYRRKRAEIMKEKW